MLDKHFKHVLEPHFIDIILYGEELEAAILCYLIRDTWSNLSGDVYINTLNYTFSVEKSIILELYYRKRLLDLILRQISALITYRGHKPLSKHSSSNNPADYNIDISINTNLPANDEPECPRQKTSKGQNDEHFLDLVNSIQNYTKLLSHNNCVDYKLNKCNQGCTFNSVDNSHSQQTPISTTSEPIPCRDRNVPMSTSHCHFIHRNISNNSSTNEEPISVVNLSHKILTPSELAILNKGLKFCPTPGEPDLSEHHNDLDKFHLRLKRFLHFYKLPNDSNVEDDTILSTSNLDPNSPFKHQKFKNPSDWIPPPVSNLENFITKNHLDLSDSVIPKNKFNNISRQERLAIKQLSTDSTIVIKQADKGGAVVLMNRDDYIKEGIRQLSDSKFYIQTPNDLTQEHYQAIETKCNDMLMREEIDLSCYDYLTHTPIRTAQFYMLPKIHKNKSPPPGRPIVSGNGCPTERISQFVDYFLQPGVKKIPSYIQDTTDFLRMLQEIGDLPDNTYLVTMDVSSLYTNIPNVEGIEACRTLLQRERPGSSHPTNDSLIELLTQVLTMNNFDFNENHYLQVGGTAMGTRVAPCYANTFMGWFEDTHVYSYHTLPKLWKRYIDDIFVIWTHSNQTLEEFIQYLNLCMPAIKFETEISQEKVNFLDVTVKLGPEGSITTDLYTKPTDSHNYLDFRSAHPKHCRTGIPYSQFLRLRRICSDVDTFTQRCREMSKHFIRANYPPQVITEAFNKVYTQSRETLLLPKTPTATKTSDSNQSFLITTFHPSFRECTNIVSRNWDLLDRSSSTRPLMTLRIIKGNRRAKNLRDLLVRARLPRITTQPSQPLSLQQRLRTTIPTRTITTRCTRLYCRYCRIINRTGTITSPITRKQYNTCRNVTCHSNNIIYCLSCRTCNKQYVGQTKRKLVERLREHFRSINNHTSTHIVGRHFNLADHRGLASLEVHVLSFIRANPNKPESKLARIKCELKWIHRLRSFVPKGLNLMDTTTYI